MKKNYFYILIRSWNNYQFFDKCIDSVLSQSYKNYKIIYIDDHSPLSSVQKTYIKNKLKGQVCIFNNKRKYSLKNAYDAINQHAKNTNGIVVNLDGDDWFYNKKSLEIINDHYQDNCQLTYGSCYVWNGEKLSTSKENKKYPKKIIRNNLYRKHPFLPLHPRTWTVKAFKKIDKNNFLKKDGTWIKFCEDQAIFYPLLENKKNKVKIIKDKIYVYNQANSLADYKINRLEQIKDELCIRLKNRSIKEPKNTGKYKMQTINIIYSPILNIGFINSILYLLESIIAQKKRVKNLYFSDKSSKNKEKLIKIVNTNYKRAKIKSYKLTNTIQKINIYKLLDLNAVKMEGNYLSNLNKLAWSIIMTKHISKKTAESLKALLPH